MKKFYSLFFLILGFTLNSNAQCPTGQIDVTIDVITDDWGYECFWDLTPTGNGCGNGALFTFGNTAEVNCTSGGTSNAISGGYGDNMTTTETIGCLMVGDCFDINYVDDFGDGGANFVVKFNGIAMFNFTSDFTTVNATYSFCVSVPPAYDAEISTAGSKYFVIPLSQASNFIAPSTITSAGTATITGAKTHVKVTQGGTQVYSDSSVSQVIPSLSSANFTVPSFSVNNLGLHTVTYVAQINETDEDTSNDTTFYSVSVSDTVYAIDNGTNVELIGLATGELGYLGNLFKISQQTKATSVSVFLGNGLQVSNFPAIDSVFKIRIFNTDPFGIPTTILATTTGVIENVLEKWYTVSFTTPVNLPVGQYLVALEEENYIQELGVTLAYSPQTSFVFSQTFIPWSPVEDFDFLGSFMIRLNLESSSLSVAKLALSELEIYPNPVRNNLIITNTKSNTSIHIFNQVGQMIQTSFAEEGKTTIDVNNLSNGIYTIKTVSENGIGLAKFIKE